MRLVAGVAMASFVLAILLSGKEKWIFVLMSTIQAKVFHVRFSNFIIYTFACAYNICENRNYKEFV